MDEADLVATIARMGIPLDLADSRALLDHLDAVLRANAAVNLTAITDRDEGISAHVLDSLACVPEVTRAPAGPMADIGSGAGYPGIPLAIATGRRTTLVESIRKKAAFLAGVAKALDHEILVAAERAEEHAARHAGAYAVVTSRAVAPLPALVELAAPLLLDGGRFIAMKGAPDPVEVERGDRAAAQVGLSPARLEPVVVPGLDAKRVLVIHEKTDSASVELPRRPGRAQKRPLA